MAIELSLSQVIELSGGRPRRMRQLANDLVFIPSESDRTGKAARLYTVSEAAIACIIAAIDEFSVTSPVLAEIAKSLRGFYRVPADYGFKNDREGEQFWRRDFYLKTLTEDLNPEQYAAALKLAERPRGGQSELTAEELHRIMNWVKLEQSRTGEKANLMSLRVASDGIWQFYIDGHVVTPDRPFKSFIVLDLGEIFSVLR